MKHSVGMRILAGGAILVVALLAASSLGATYWVSGNVMNLVGAIVLVIVGVVGGFGYALGLI